MLSWPGLAVGATEGNEQISDAGAASSGQVVQFTRSIVAAADTTVRTDLDLRRNDNYGHQQVVVVGGSRGGGGTANGAADGMRALLQFDLSGLGSALDLRGALLDTSVNTILDPAPTPSSFTIAVHQIVASRNRTPWREGNGFEGDLATAPPQSADTEDAEGVAWVGAGDGGDTNNVSQPDVAAKPVAVTTVYSGATAPGDHLTWDIASLVSAWRKGTPNYGLELRDVVGNGFFRELYLDAKDGAALRIPDPRWHAAPRLLLNLRFTKSSCKKSGWQQLAPFTFASQTACEQYVATYGT